MNGKTLANLESRLRYYEDLHLGPFYRDRAAGAPVESSRSSQSPIGAAANRRAGRDSQTPAAPQAPHAPAPVAPAAPVAISPQSLFEPAERIENDTLERIREDIGECTRCKLHKSRSRIVFGDGNPRTDLAFVGEGPGEEEDRQGLPFVGRAGKLLTQMIDAMGLDRKQVYICNVVKCRPPSNRTPERDEMSTCGPFLERQLMVIQPKVIVCLGSVAAQALLATGEPMGRVRGKWFQWRGMKLLPTYHPAYLLRNPSAKGIVWEDLQNVMAELGLKPPRKSARKS
jgi:DNA polymerase